MHKFYIFSQYVEIVCNQVIKLLKPKTGKGDVLRDKPNMMRLNVLHSKLLQILISIQTVPFIVCICMVSMNKICRADCSHCYSAISKITQSPNQISPALGIRQPLLTFWALVSFFDYLLTEKPTFSALYSRKVSPKPEMSTLARLQAAVVLYLHKKSGVEAISLILKVQWIEPFKQRMIQTKVYIGLVPYRLCQFT